MTIVDKVIAAVTPLESDADRLEARQKAKAVARPGSWLEMILDHHLEIEAAFAAVRNAVSVPQRMTAQKALALILTGHSLAEESVIYPALALAGEKGHAEMAYLEQSTAKVEMAALEGLDPMSDDFLDKLEHIRGAVAHHVYEEEGTWFVDLAQKADAATQDKLSMRYDEEFTRYFSEPALQEEVSDYGGSEIGMRGAGGYSGSTDPSKRGGIPPSEAIEGGVYGGLHETDRNDAGLKGER